MSDMLYSDVATKCMSMAENLGTPSYFEDYAQKYCDQFYHAFKESTVLSRIFIARPYESLPKDIIDFTDGLASTVGVKDQIRDTSPILSLAGTFGRERAWSHRKTSGGHKGIPLVSSSFVTAVPMLMGVFTQVFGNLDWLDLHDHSSLRKITGKSSGSFYVKSAKDDVDNQNRKIIAAQDFVNKEGVGSVLGLAGGLADGSMLVMLNFMSEELDERYINALMPAMSIIRARAIECCLSNKIFHAA